MELSSHQKISTYRKRRILQHLRPPNKHNSVNPKPNANLSHDQEVAAERRLKQNIHSPSNISPATNINRSKSLLLALCVRIRCMCKVAIRLALEAASKQIRNTERIEETHCGSGEFGLCGCVGWW